MKASPSSSWSEWLSAEPQQCSPLLRRPPGWRWTCTCPCRPSKHLFASASWGEIPQSPQGKDHVHHCSAKQQPSGPLCEEERCAWQHLLGTVGAWVCRMAIVEGQKTLACFFSLGGNFVFQVYLWSSNHFFHDILEKRCLWVYLSTLHYFVITSHHFFLTFLEKKCLQVHLWRFR